MIKDFKVVLAAFFMSATAWGQVDYIDVKQLPRPDCTGKKTIWAEYNKSKEVTSVIPDVSLGTAEIKYIINLLNEGEIKQESELLDIDYERNLKIYGLISDFKHWDKFNVPIEKTTKGFRFNGSEYQGEGDGFFYINNKAMVFSGNSYNIINELLSTNIAFYEYLIFKEGLLSKYGLPGGKEIDMSEIISTNYIKSSAGEFNLFLDKKLDFKPMDLSFVEDIRKTMDLPKLNLKINAYLNNDPNAVRLFSNFWGMTGCETIKDGTTINTVGLNAIHVYGSNIDILKHEAFHLIWRRQFANGIGGTLNSFYVEGIQEYYQQVKDSGRVYINLEVYKKHEGYDITNLVVRGSSQDFWAGPSENDWPISYPISGLFVKFLIDKYGLEKFKEFYSIKDTKIAYKKIYDIEPSEAIVMFTGWAKTIRRK